MKHSTFYNAPNGQETQNGWIYLILSQLGLPYALRWFSGILAVPLTPAKINFLFYCINFLAVVWIFRRFLADSMKSAVRCIFPVLWYAALGYLGSQALSELLEIVFAMIVPKFSNFNDASVTGMIRSEPLLALAVVLLVPVTEECFFRGLMFRNLHGWNPTAAYLISMAAFSTVHVVGYLGSVPPLHLLIAALQYLPAGYCLAWCYRQTGTIITPVLMHTLVNLMGVYAVMR